MSARVRIALALLRAEQHALESRITQRFAIVLSRRLDALVLAIEALETAERAQRAA